MIDDLKKFITAARGLMNDGTAKVSRDLSDYDLAVMYSTSKLYEMGFRYVTTERVWHMLAIVAPELAKEEA